MVSAGRHGRRGEGPLTRVVLARVVLARVVLTVALLAGVVLTTPAAQADDGLAVTSTSRYEVRPEEERVVATMTMTLRNVAPTEDGEDGGFRFYYYDAYGIPLPSEATDVRATSEGVALPVRRRAIPGQPGFGIVEVGFPDLLYPDSRTLELSFTLEGRPPRSEDPTRIGEGYATFSVFGPGDPGQSLVEVVVPSGLEVDSTASSFTPEERPDGTTVFTTREDNLSPGFAATMSVRGDAVGEERPVTVGGVDLVLVPYPNDPAWADFIEERADTGLPVLEDLLGEEWPGEIDRIREDSGSLVRGFEGWYSRSEREIVLGEALEDGVLFHELAHAWVNTATVEDRWLSEGLAELLAEETARRTGGSFTTPAAVARDHPAALPLQSWESSPGFRGTEVDAWAYPASYQVVTRLLDGLPDEGLSAVLGDVVTATSPWDLPGRRSLSGGALRTTTFLDLLDAHGAPAAADGTAAELYATWVLTDEDAAALADRPEARSAYAAYVAAGPWGAPLAVRSAMARWDHSRALTLMTERADLPAAAATVQELSERTGTGLPERIRRGYEDADTDRELDATAAAVSTATNALRRYEEARAAVDADRGPFGRLGATVLRLETAAETARENIALDEMAASVTASELVIDRAPWSTRLGVGIVAATVLLLALLSVLVIALVRRGRRTGRRPAEPAASAAP